MEDGAPRRSLRRRLDEDTPLTYASLRGRLTVDDVPDGVCLFVCAMQFEPLKVERDADSIRLMRVLEKTRIDAIFSIGRVPMRHSGYSNGDFSARIPYMSELRPHIVALDYNWCPLEYVRSPDRYNANWFTGKIQSAMLESNAEIFILPNFIVFDAPQFGYMSELFEGNGQRALSLERPVESFDSYNRSRRTPLELACFTITRKEAAAVHPLVRATILAEGELHDTRNSTRGWSVQQKYVHPDAAFFVFHRPQRRASEVFAHLESLSDPGVRPRGRIQARHR